MRRVLLAWLFFPAAALAQLPELLNHQQAVFQRDQQSASFALQLQQSQRALRGEPGNALQERLDVDNLAERQLREARPDSPATPAARIGERERFATERLLVLPPPVVRAIVRPAGYSGILDQSLTVTSVASGGTPPYLIVVPGFVAPGDVATYHQ